MQRWAKILIIMVVAGGALLAGWFMRTPRAKAPTNHNVNTSSATIAFSTDDLPDRDGRYDFHLNLPAAWAADYKADSSAIIFYIPTSDVSTLSTTQVLVTLATTLPTGPSTTSQIDGQVAHWFKQRTRPPSPTSIPTWTLRAHRQAWVTVKDRASLYYVFDQGPAVTDAQFTSLVMSLRFGQINSNSQSSTTVN